MGLYNKLLEEMYENDMDENVMYNMVMGSDISILSVWLNLFGKCEIKPRCDNIYYCKCPFHESNGLSCVIDENRKGYFCFGCNTGGSIIELISRVFNIKLADATFILYAYAQHGTAHSITDVIDDPMDLKILKRISLGSGATSAKKYFDESGLKSAKLNEKIYIYTLTHEIDSEETQKKLAKKLCCTSRHIQKRIEHLDDPEYLPFI